MLLMSIITVVRYIFYAFMLIASLYTLWFLIWTLIGIIVWIKRDKK
jgi:hypothetical protein